MASEPTYGRTQLEALFASLDGALDAPAKVIVIGGSAAVLGYGVDVATTDVDTFQSDLGPLHRAAARVGASVPIGNVGVADFPHDFESRLVQVLPSLERLRVLVPERHDLALSKLVRGAEHDLVHLERLHEKAPLQLGVLEARLAEMDAVIGGRRNVELNLLNCVERLFGELERDRLAKRLRR